MSLLDYITRYCIKVYGNDVAEQLVKDFAPLTIAQGETAIGYRRERSSEMEIDRLIHYLDRCIDGWIDRDGCMVGGGCR